MPDDMSIQNMDDNVFLSVIIPFHNSGRYLKQCLESLLKADGSSSFEMILIDDGSSDDSGEIAGKYSLKYPNIKVITMSRAGQSEARNAGIRASSGRYVFFCDSDDEVAPGSFSKALKRAEDTDADIILWDAEPFNDDGTPLPQKRRDYFIHRGLSPDDGIISGKQSVEKQLDDHMDFPATVWLGLHKRQFILENDLFFEKDLMHEDELWVIKTLLTAKSVSYINEKIYRYRNRKGSVMNPETDDRSSYIESLLKIYPALYAFCEDTFGNAPFTAKIEACLTRRYLFKISDYDFVRCGYGSRIDRKKLWKTAGRFIDKLRVIRLNLLLFVQVNDE